MAEACFMRKQFNDIQINFKPHCECRYVAYDGIPDQTMFNSIIKIFGGCGDSPATVYV